MLCKKLKRYFKKWQHLGAFFLLEIQHIMQKVKVNLLKKIKFSNFLSGEGKDKIFVNIKQVCLSMNHFTIQIPLKNKKDPGMCTTQI